jgi:APA family basic amino acid/polyamine antiporter
MGEFVAWIIGWDLVLEYALGAATVAVSWSQYVDKFLANYGIHIPQSILGPWDTKPGIINLPSILISLLSLLLMRGTKESASLNNILVILKVTVVIVFIGLGWGLLTTNHTPFIPVNEGEALLSSGRCLFYFFSSDYFGHYGWSGILRGQGLCFCFIGFDAVSTAAQEAKNPQKECQLVF